MSVNTITLKVLDLLIYAFIYENAKSSPHKDQLLHI